jgi:hypothetical protein
MMAEAVDLNLFVGRDSLDYNDESVTIYFEPECATVGASWDIFSDGQASNGKYVTVKPGLQSLSQAPTGNESLILVSFSVDTTGNYSVFARLNCPTPNDDSFWVKMDDGAFQSKNGLGTSGWEWRKFDDYMLTEGDHTLAIAYREDGAKLDKIGVSNAAFAPLGMGEKAENVCVTTGVLNSKEAPDDYALGQNYPNPFNPSTTITFTLPIKTFVTLKVYDALGREVSELISSEMLPGTHSRQLSAEGLTSGTYFFRLQAGPYVETKKLVLTK